MKAKYDIYIRKDLQPLLDDEENMSGLINNLLANHFGKINKQVEDFASAGIRSNVKHEYIDGKVVSTITPNLKDVKSVKTKIKEIVDESKTKFCQHGFAIGFCKYGCKK